MDLPRAVSVQAELKVLFVAHFSVTAGEIPILGKVRFEMAGMFSIESHVDFLMETGASSLCKGSPSIGPMCGGAQRRYNMESTRYNDAAISSTSTATIDPLTGRLSQSLSGYMTESSLHDHANGLRVTTGETYLHAKLDVRIEAKMKLFLNVKVGDRNEGDKSDSWIPNKQGLSLFKIHANIMDVCYDQTKTNFACAFGNMVISRAVTAADQFATALVNTAENICEASVNGIKNSFLTHPTVAIPFICDMADSQICPEVNQCPTDASTLTDTTVLGECATYYACRHYVRNLPTNSQNLCTSSTDSHAWSLTIPKQGAEGTIQADEDTTEKIWENTCISSPRATQQAVKTFVSKKLRLVGGAQVKRPLTIQLGVDPSSIPPGSRRSANGKEFCETLKVVKYEAGKKSLALVCITSSFIETVYLGTSSYDLR